MKRVVTSSMVAHLWANQSQADARTATNNMFFNGDTIYSYGHHFPMARHVKTLDGHAIVLMTMRTYSNTTSNHLREVRQAIRHLTVIDCVNPTANYPREHTENLLAIRKECFETLTKATRSRTYTEWLLQSADNLARQHAAYRRAFGLELDAALVIEANWKVQVAGRVAAQKELAKEQAKQRAEREAKHKLEAIADLEKWKLGEIYHRSGFGNYSLPIALRLSENKEDIETSAGASVPATHARRIWKLILKIRANGTPYQRNGHTEHVGNFSVDSIAVDGTLVAGCHTITFEAMQELAGKLGW